MKTLLAVMILVGAGLTRAASAQSFAPSGWNAEGNLVVKVLNPKHAQVSVRPTEKISSINTADEFWIACPASEFVKGLASFNSYDDASKCALCPDEKACGEITKPVLPKSSTSSPDKKTKLKETKRCAMADDDQIYCFSRVSLGKGRNLSGTRYVKGTKVTMRTYFSADSSSMVVIWHQEPAVATTDFPEDLMSVPLVAQPAPATPRAPAR